MMTDSNKHLLINSKNQLLEFDTALGAIEYLKANKCGFGHCEVFYPCTFNSLNAGVLAGCVMAVSVENKQLRLRAVGSVDWIIEDHPNADLYFQNP